jgi:hypothetical protein
MNSFRPRFFTPSLLTLEDRELLGNLLSISVANHLGRFSQKTASSSIAEQMPKASALPLHFFVNSGIWQVPDSHTKNSVYFTDRSGSQLHTAFSAGLMASLLKDNMLALTTLPIEEFSKNSVDKSIISTFMKAAATSDVPFVPFFFEIRRDTSVIDNF